METVMPRFRLGTLVLLAAVTAFALALMLRMSAALLIIFVAVVSYALLFDG